MNLKIGYIRNRYPEIRNIINRGGQEIQYVHIGKARLFLLDVYRAFEIISLRLLKSKVQMNSDIHMVYKSVSASDIDVIHTFNTVCDVSVPWVSTFETMIPRTNCLCCRDWEVGTLVPDEITLYGFKLCASEHCKTLIALSESTKIMQTLIMEALKIPNREVIAEKIKVLPPPQPVLITPDELNKKFQNIHERIEFLFIGGLFYRKGGAQILDAMQAMVSKGMKLHLTIVSSLVDDGFTRISAEEKQQYQRMISECDWITHYPKLPNAEVLKLCKKAHVGMLPSMADTYGYAILEMQAGGCPVITTDIRAMAEINNNACGYIIPVPKYPSTEAIYDTPESLEILKRTIYQGLRNVLDEIQNNPDAVEKKSEAVLSRLKRDHSPEKYARELSLIYEKAKTESKSV